MKSITFQINKEIDKKELLDYIEKNKTVGSDPNFAETGAMPLKLIKKTLKPVLTRIPFNYKIVSAWANIISKGFECPGHMHGADYQGCYYLQVPKDNTCNLVFLDNDEIYEPKENDFIMFEGKLEHEMSKMKSSGLRISIAMEINLI